MPTRKRKKKNAPGAGRRPAGEAGTKSSTYPKVRIAPDALKGLQAIAATRKVAVWEIVTEAARLLIRTTKQG